MGERRLVGDLHRLGQPFFSADSHHMAYAAKNGQTLFVVIDGKIGPPYGQMPAALAFRPDGSLEFAAIRDRVLYHVERPGKK